MVENSVGLQRFSENGTERENSKIQIIMLQGMADIGFISPKMADLIGASPFDPGWYKNDVESFDQKLERLHYEVEQARGKGMEVILLGISAGGGMGLTYMLRHPEVHIRHLFTLNGVVDPNIPQNEKDGKLESLRCKSTSFTAMTDYLTKQLHPNGVLNEVLISKLHLANRVSTYSSNADETVPLVASEPGWVKNKRRVGSGKHALSIGRTLIHDLQAQLKQLEKAKFD